jgi:hypothetical protein
MSLMDNLQQVFTTTMETDLDSVGQLLRAGK